MAGRDRINDIERRVGEAEDAIARLPIRDPVSAAQGGNTLFLGQPTTNVTPATTSFTLTNVTELSSGEAHANILVKNTQKIEVDAGDKFVYAIKDEAADAYETWGPKGEGGGLEGKSFRLTADKAASSPTAQGILTDENGDDIPGETIILIDKTYGPNITPSGNRFPGGRFGLTNYQTWGAENQPAYIGQCRDLGIPDWNSTGLPAYEIIWMEGPLTGMIVSFINNLNSGDGANGINVDIEQELGSNGATRMPKLESIPASPSPVMGIAVFDPDEIITKEAKAGSQWVAMRNPGDGRYYVVAPADWVDGGKAQPDYDDTKPQGIVSEVGGQVHWVEVKFVEIIIDTTP